MNQTDIKNLQVLRKSEHLEWLREMGATHVKLGDFEVTFAPKAEPEPDHELASQMLGRNLHERDPEVESAEGRVRSSASNPMNSPELFGGSVPTLPDYGSDP